MQVTHAADDHQTMMENGLNRLMRTVSSNGADSNGIASAAYRRRTTMLYVVAAVLVLIGGYVHLKLYFDGYRDVPDANLGRSFLANSVASLVVAVALVALRHWIAALAALVLANATLLAFWVSRTDRGIFGFNENGFEPSPEAVIALVCEVGTAVVALVLLAGSVLANGSRATPGSQ